MKQVTINHLGEFYWPDQDRKCLEHLQTYWKDAGKALKYCKGFNVCIQAGGNVGVWPRYLKDKFKTVYTFEPNPENFKYLNMNVPDENVIKLQAALGDRNGLVKTTLTDKEVNNIGAYQLEDGGITPTFTVDQLMLGGLDLLILDIEGYELFAVKGAINTILAYSPVIHLEDKGLSTKYGVEQGGVLDYLSQFGYSVIESFNRDFICVKQ